jgi:hypothetical protein
MGTYRLSGAGGHEHTDIVRCRAAACRMQGELWKSTFRGASRSSSVAKAGP